jgi:hypothetical protein
MARAAVPNQPAATVFVIVYVLLIEVDAVVVLATSVTATTGMLAVLA